VLRWIGCGLWGAGLRGSGHDVSCRYIQSLRGPLRFVGFPFRDLRFRGLTPANFFICNTYENGGVRVEA